MKAVLEGHVVAEAPDDETVKIEGNVYFPPGSVVTSVLRKSETPYTCPWKGRSQYFNTVVDGVEERDTAWSYPSPLPSAIERVGADFSGYVAFAPTVSVEAS